MGQGIGELMKDKKFLFALLMEFTGLAFYQFIGDFSPISSTNFAIVNGIVFASLIYLTRHMSGGHLNPSVTIAAAVSGHMEALKALFYVIAQILGGLLGSLVLYLLDNYGWDCYVVREDINKRYISLFVWEIVITMFFILVVYSCVVAPGHGDFGPFIIGFTLIACILGGEFSSRIINPARMIASVSIGTKNCSYEVVYYIAGDFVGAVLAGLSAKGMYGQGSWD